ncbi:MAG: efflux RND transporter permease subunit [Bacteroidales bacterium]|nr:efflux RND transporter permease subunit [Bacteroidales bacterium]
MLKKENFFVKNWVAALAITVVTLLIGIVGLETLSVEQYPDIAPPTISISANYDGADANAVMSSVIMPLESAVNGVEDMLYMTATANSDGSASIDVYFKQGTDADKACVNVQNRVNQAQGMLPAPVLKRGVTVMKNQNSILQIAALVSTDDKFDFKFVSNYLDINVMPRIKRVKGVGKALLLGNSYGMRVWLKPDVMATYGISTDEVTAAINEQNSVTPVGNLENKSYRFNIEYKGLLEEVPDFENIIVRSNADGSVVRLCDIARVELGTNSYSFRSSFEGHPSVLFVINQAPGANATQVNEEIAKVFEEMSDQLPAGLKFEVLETSNDFLHASMHNVVETLIIAIILVVLVVYLFLQNFKATIIPSISIIVSLLGTFAIVKMAGFSLNLLTLFALVLAIGTVVDDAIVVVEAVMAKFESGYTNAREATTDAMEEVRTAVVSCTLVFMAVFIPVTFMPGTSGTFFTQFGITMAAAVGLSMVNALTLCPALCAIMMRPEKEGEQKGFSYRIKKAYDTCYNALLGKYMKATNKFIKKSRYAWILLIIFSAGLVYLMTHSRQDLVPQEDQGFLMVDLQLTPGTYLDQTEETANKLENFIKSIDDVESYSRITGYSLQNSVASTNCATIFVRLKNWEERSFYSISNVQQQILGWAALNLPEADINAFQMPQIPGYGVGSLVDIKLQDRSGGDHKQFIDLCQQFMLKLNERPEIQAALTSYSSNFPKYKLEVDVAECKRAGTSPTAVLNTVGNYFAGSYISNYIKFGKVYQVMIQADAQYRRQAQNLNSLQMPINGQMVPVSRFVTLTETFGTSIENHFNLYSCFPVLAMPAEGHANADVRQAVQEVADEVFPDGYGYEYGGMSREEAESAGSNMTLIIYGICILLIYLIMGCLYNSLFIPFAVLLSIPFGLFGSFLIIKPLESMGLGVNIYVQTGVIMLIGLLAKTAILITEFAVQRHHEGLSAFDAAIQAAKDRLRPILMTVACMVIGMIPLVIEGGAGAVGNKSLALTVVGGMTVGTVALVFVVPAFYIVFQNIHDRFESRNNGDAAAAAIEEAKPANEE